MFKPGDLGKIALKRASGTLLGALSRADELGGKLRDQLSEKLTELSAARQALRGPQPAAAPVAEAQVSQPPAAKPSATKTPAPGLGDAGRAVQIFGRASCPWSGRAVALVKRAGLDHSYFDLNGYGADSVLRELAQETKQHTVPYVYVRGRFIGGYNALDELYRLGHLDYLTLPEDERARHPMHGRIEVAPRQHDGEHVPSE
jgi:glutaredoxin